MATSKKKTKKSSAKNRPAKQLELAFPRPRKRRVSDNVKVVAEINRYGHLVITPVSREFMRRIEKAYKGARRVPEDVYIQEDYAVDEFIDGSVPKSKRKDLREGGVVVFLMDADLLAAAMGA